MAERLKIMIGNKEVAKRYVGRFLVWEAAIKEVTMTTNMGFQKGKLTIFVPSAYLTNITGRNITKIKTNEGSVFILTKDSFKLEYGQLIARNISKQLFDYLQFNDTYESDSTYKRAKITLFFD